MAPKKKQENPRRSERTSNLKLRNLAPEVGRTSTGRGKGTKHQGYRGDNEIDQDDQEVDETDQDNQEVDENIQDTQGVVKDGRANRKKLSKEAARMLYEELEKYGPECQKKGQGSNQENVKRRLTNSLSKALTAFRDKQRYDDYKALRNEKTFPEVKKFVEEDSHHMTKAALLRSLFVKYNIANSIQGRRVQDINPPKVKPKRV